MPVRVHDPNVTAVSQRDQQRDTRLVQLKLRQKLPARLRTAINELRAGLRLARREDETSRPQEAANYRNKLRATSTSAKI